MEKIDVVVPWVDGNDPEWLAEKATYQNTIQPFLSGADSPNRYRSWDSIYLCLSALRANLPWARRILLVTWGHKPRYLDQILKLKSDVPIELVKFTDFIPSQYLPTYNITGIETHMHRLPGLSELFLYVCDDHYILSPMDRESYISNDGKIIVNTDDEYLEKLPIYEKFIRKLGLRSHTVPKTLVLWWAFKSRLLALIPTETHYTKLVANTTRTFKTAFPEARFSYHPHFPLVFRKDDFRRIWDLFPLETESTAKSLVRGMDNITPPALAFSLAMKDKAVEACVRDEYYTAIVPNERRLQIELAECLTHDIVCLNDELPGGNVSPKIHETVYRFYQDAALKRLGSPELHALYKELAYADSMRDLSSSLS